MPTLKGELVYGIVWCTIPAMLNPTLTASWEKGLDGVSGGTIGSDEYMKKLNAFVTKWVNDPKQKNEIARLNRYYHSVLPYYEKSGGGKL